MWDLRWSNLCLIIKEIFLAARQEPIAARALETRLSMTTQLIQACLIALCILVTMNQATADSRSRLLTLLAEYEEAKEDLLVELANADRARKQRRTTDTQSIQQLSTESLQLLRDANVLYGEGKTQAQQHPDLVSELPALYALKIACDALYQTGSSELEYERRPKSAFILNVRLKYEDLLRTADMELKRTLAQLHLSVPPESRDAQK